MKGGITCQVNSLHRKSQMVGLTAFYYGGLLWINWAATVRSVRRLPGGTTRSTCLWGALQLGEGRRTRFIGGATDLVVSLPEDLKTGSNSRSAPISLPQTVISSPNSSGLFALTQELPRKSLATDRASDGWQAKPYRLDEIIRVGCSLQIGPGLFGHRLDYDDSSQGGRACETRNGRLGA